MKDKQPLNLKHIACLYLAVAFILLLFFRYAVRSDSALQYAGEILSGLITMVGIYYAFADSEQDRAIETRPRFSASVSSYPVTPEDKTTHHYVFFAGGKGAVARHLNFTLHNEGSTEINILGIFIGKPSRKNELHWLPYLTYQLNWNIENGNPDLILLHENLDINASLLLNMDVANKVPNDAGVENPASEQTRNRFIVEVWYQNDYSPACYVKQYIVEHIPLEHWTSKTKTAWDQALDCHANAAVEKTMSDFQERCRNADAFYQMITDSAKRRKQSETVSAR